MKKIVAASLLAATALTPAAAKAQDMAQMQQMMADMQSELATLRGRVAELEAEQAQRDAQQAQMHANMQEMHSQMVTNMEEVQAAVVAAPAPTVTSPSPLEISWHGAPELEGEGGWTFKPRGRLQADTGFISVPDSTGRPDGFGSELRRARLGVEGTVPGGFGYKFEIDFAGNDVDVTDAIITYKDGPLTATVGQHNNFQSLEELTSSRFSSFIERAAFTDAFNFERRLGLSVQVKASDSVLLQGGLFSDNISNTSGNSMSADGRVVFMPRTGDTQLHLAGSIHYTDVGAGELTRYRQRPLVHFTGERFINTGNMNASSELGLGVEAAVIHGPFHAVAEGYWQHTDLIGSTMDPTFFGGYVEAGVFLTRGDSRGYRGGVFERTRPAHPVNEGGMGAFQLNVRYDYLDLTDAGIVGGTQNGYQASLVWVPTDYTRLLLNYGRMEYDDAAYATASGSRNYSVDVLGLRAQIDF
ncbi:MAG: carbohydrate porin [Erythrobacter sp.]|nr:carbohydrate porin [Erythrobacter sp.]